MNLQQTIRRSSLNRSLQFEHSNESHQGEQQQFNQNYDSQSYVGSKMNPTRFGRMLYKKSNRYTVSLESRFLDESKSLATLINPLTSLSSCTQAKSIHNQACVSLDPGMKYTKTNKKLPKKQTLIQAEKIYGCLSSSNRVKMQPSLQVVQSSKEKRTKEDREKLQSKILSEGARGYDSINKNRKGSISQEQSVPNMKLEERGKILKEKNILQEQVISNCSTSNNNYNNNYKNQINNSNNLNNNRCASMRNFVQDTDEEENRKGAHKVLLEALNSRNSSNCVNIDDGNNNISNLHIDMHTIKLENQKELLSSNGVISNSQWKERKDSSRVSGNSYKQGLEVQYLSEKNKNKSDIAAISLSAALPSFSASELKYINGIRSGTGEGQREECFSSQVNKNEKQQSCRIATAVGVLGGHSNSRYQKDNHENKQKENNNNNNNNTQILYGKRFDLPREDPQMISVRGRQMNGSPPQTYKESILTSKSMSLCEDNRVTKKFTQNHSNHRTMNYQDSNDESTALPSFVANSPNPQQNMQKQSTKIKKIIKNIQQLPFNSSMELQKRINEEKDMEKQQAKLKQKREEFLTQQSQCSQLSQLTLKSMQSQEEIPSKVTSQQSILLTDTGFWREQARNQNQLVQKMKQCFEKFKSAHFNNSTLSCQSAQQSQSKETPADSSKSLKNPQQQQLNNNINNSNNQTQLMKQYKLHNIGLNMISRLLKRKSLMIVFIELVKQQSLKS